MLQLQLLFFLLLWHLLLHAFTAAAAVEGGVPAADADDVIALSAAIHCK